MNLPWQFPDPMVEAKLRSEEFQRLSVDERWRELAALFAMGWSMVKSSPHRTAIEQQMADDELRWQQTQRDLFARHS